MLLTAVQQLQHSSS